MRSLSIACGLSTATIDTMGAHVDDAVLDGEEVVKPSEDGSPTHGGVAVLVPYAGRVEGGEYLFAGRSHSLPVSHLGHDIHGFAKDRPWKVTTADSKSMTLECRLKGPGYPWTLDAKVTYSIGRRNFSTHCGIRNSDTRECPLVVGFHPYYLAERWRVQSAGRAFRYILQKRYFPTGDRERCSLSHLRPDDELDDCFKVNGAVELRTRRRSLLIRRLRMPYLVLYNGKYAEDRSLAIEPYTGLPDAFNNGIGLIKLTPGRTFECGYGFGLRRT